MENQLDLFKKYVHEKDYIAVNQWISIHYKDVFTPLILTDLHDQLSLCDLMDLSTFSKLIKAWIAFIYGDNPELSKSLRNIQEMSIMATYELSLYHSLLALCGDLYAIGSEEKLELALKALRILGEDCESLFFANAHLTLGQIFSDRNDYRSASHHFQTAKEVFETLNCDFLAIISDVNKLLNLYKLGEYSLVIEESERVLRRNARFNGAEPESLILYVYHLPIGMAMIELGKLDIAAHHLNRCKNSIDALNMFHLHGLIEWMTLKVFLLKASYDALKQELEHGKQKFSTLSSPLIEGIFDYYGMLYTYELGETVDPVLSDRLSLLLTQQKHSLNFILVEMMVQLQLRNLLSFYTKKDLELLNIQVHTHSIEPLKGLVSELLSKTSLDLTDRELEILSLVASGNTNEDVGKILFISTGTVKWHLNNIYSKLEVKNRIQAIEKIKRIGKP